jgi:hypothetical protein
VRPQEESTFLFKGKDVIGTRWRLFSIVLHIRFDVSRSQGHRDSALKDWKRTSVLSAICLSREAAVGAKV